MGDVPRSLAWAGDSLCLGTRGEYSIIHMAGQVRSQGVVSEVLVVACWYYFDPLLWHEERNPEHKFSKAEKLELP